GGGGGGGEGSARGAPRGGGDAAEGRLFLGRSGGAQRRPIDAVARQPPPALGVSSRRSPDGRRLREERRQWLWAQPFSGLGDGGPTHRATARVRGPDEGEMPHHLADRAVTQQRHPAA